MVLSRVDAATASTPGTGHRLLAGTPAPAFFCVSAIFHYLGPAMAVLLFASVDVLGVAWLRVASAAAVFVVWRRPWRLIGRLAPDQRRVLIGLGVVLAAMNSAFYLAIARLPLATVGAIELLGTLVLAAIGIRSRRNALALCIAVLGVAILTDVQLVAEPVGIAFAFVNCALFMLYVILGHRIANRAPARGSSTVWGGVDQFGVAMVIAALVISPFGVGDAAVAFTNPKLLLAGIGVGICSSVVPYVADQLAMARLSRDTYALMLCILPAVATVIGVLVLAQLPTAADLAGISMVIIGIAVHRQPRRAVEK